MDGNITIKNMIREDISELYKAFLLQGWEKPLSLFEQYYEEQSNKERKIYVAVCENKILGYATLLPSDQTGPFSNKKIPAICDFNILKKYQGKGIGTAILDYVEGEVKHYSEQICLGVGLHYGYGAAQRLYIKRGYIPDGSGVWYQDKKLEQNAECINDDDLILYLSKILI